MATKIESQLTITYHWNCDQGIDIPEKHLEALKEDAEDRIFDQIKNGIREGELHTSVRFGKDEVPEEDEDEGLTYTGWWANKKIRTQAEIKELITALEEEQSQLLKNRELYEHLDTTLITNDEKENRRKVVTRINEQLNHVRIQLHSFRWVS
jgi:cupin superfamily acireductone dioxygenase involved in methionine salvage